MMVKGSSTKEIAFDLNINTRTVEAHRQKMMAKLNVVNMTMLVSFAVTHVGNYGLDMIKKLKNLISRNKSKYTY